MAHLDSPNPSVPTISDDKKHEFQPPSPPPPIPPVSSGSSLRETSPAPSEADPAAGPDLVIGITSTPDRKDSLRLALESLHRQTAKIKTIHLGLPLYYHRFKKLTDVRDYKWVTPVDFPLVKVHYYPTDEGPLTKLLVVLDQETKSDENLRIVLVDDDHVYDTEAVATLYRHSIAHPDFCFAHGGQLISQIEGRQGFVCNYGLYLEVPMLWAFGGVIYRKGLLPSPHELRDFLAKDPLYWFNDDLVLAALVKARKWVLPFLYSAGDRGGGTEGHNTAMALFQTNMRGRNRLIYAKIKDMLTLPKPTSWIQPVCPHAGVALCLDPKAISDPKIRPAVGHEKFGKWPEFRPI